MRKGNRQSERERDFRMHPWRSIRTLGRQGYHHVLSCMRSQKAELLAGMPRIRVLRSRFWSDPAWIEPITPSRKPLHVMQRILSRLCVDCSELNLFYYWDQAIEIGFCILLLSSLRILLLSLLISWYDARWLTIIYVGRLRLFLRFNFMISDL